MPRRTTLKAVLRFISVSVTKGLISSAQANFKSIPLSRTRQEEKKPICDVATSHLARRTFIGNLYRQVKDPNLVASMSGHANGSVAFQRYRAIDDDMKKSLVELIQ